jgi:hypothetical protein
MGEGLFYEARLKIGMADRIPGNLTRRRRTEVLGYGLLSRMVIRSAINADIIVS